MDCGLGSAAVAAVLLAGCAGGSPGSASSSPSAATSTAGPTPAPTVPVPTRVTPTPQFSSVRVGSFPAPTVTITRTGGIAAISQMVVIDGSGAWVFTDRRAGTTRRGQLSGAQISRLAQLVSDPALASEARRSPPPVRCADGITTTITVGDLTVEDPGCGGGNRPAADAVLRFVTDTTACEVRMRKLVVAVVLLGGVALAGCSTPASGPGPVPTGPSASDQVSGLITPISITRTGGIVGVRQSLDISADGSWVFTDSKTRQSSRGAFTAAQLTTLNALLTDPKLIQQMTERSAPAGVCADGFDYTIKFGAADSFSFSDCGDMQPAVAAVIRRSPTRPALTACHQSMVGNGGPRTSSASTIV